MPNVIQILKVILCKKLNDGSTEMLVPNTVIANGRNECSALEPNAEVLSDLLLCPKSPAGKSKRHVEKIPFVSSKFREIQLKNKKEKKIKINQLMNTNVKNKGKKLKRKKIVTIVTNQTKIRQISTGPKEQILVKSKYFKISTTRKYK